MRTGATGGSVKKKAVTLLVCLFGIVCVTGAEAADPPCVPVPAPGVYEAKSFEELGEKLGVIMFRLCPGQQPVWLHPEAP